MTGAIKETQIVPLRCYKAVQVGTPQASIRPKFQLAHPSHRPLAMPAEQTVPLLPSEWQWWQTGIISIVFLHSQSSICIRFLFQVTLPGLLRGNLEDHLG